ncbi:hypothetical protein VKT23_000369 [Stygiomarasmius scandens]|uniref:Uncharacterized protein n=1 Tax=Marasmiellus scandens TaxID=2682957 RepID=A0ABR1K9B5_9AGAR
MQKCHSLNRLPKAPRVTSLLYRYQRPGDQQTAHIPYLLDRKILDPTHPAAKLNRNRLPAFRNNVLRVHAIPHGLLEFPEFPRQPPFDVPIELWKDRIARTLHDPEFQSNYQTKFPGDVKLAPVHLPKHQKPKRVPMAMVTILTKKATSKFKYVRLKIINRIKATLGLIVVRGAEVKDGKVVVNDEKAVEMMDRWILRGWTYTFFVPSLELYRLPLPELVTLLRKAMSETFEMGTRLEKEWAYRALKEHDQGPQRSTRTQAPSPVFNQPHPLTASRYPKMQDKTYAREGFLGEPLADKNSRKLEDDLHEEQELQELSATSTQKSEKPARERSTLYKPVSKLETEDEEHVPKPKGMKLSFSWRDKVKQEDGEDWEEDLDWELDFEEDSGLEPLSAKPSSKSASDSDPWWMKESDEPTLKLKIPTPSTTPPSSPAQRSFTSPSTRLSARESAMKNVFNKKPIIENLTTLKTSKVKAGAPRKARERPTVQPEFKLDRDGPKFPRTKPRPDDDELVLQGRGIEKGIMSRDCGLTK